MFSLNESWSQEEGETELHDALFERKDGVSVDPSTKRKIESKKRKNKRKTKLPDSLEEEYNTCVFKYSEDGGESAGESMKLTADKEKDGISSKGRKRMRKRSKIEEKEEEEDGQYPLIVTKRTKFILDPSDSSHSETLSRSCQSSFTTCYRSAASEKKCKGAGKRTALKSKVADKMEGARFRWINEQLYTTTGHEAKQLFDDDPSLFDVYHSGFATQVSKWPVNPLDKVIAYVKSLPSNFVVADFGCGEARLAQSVPHTVHSFDLVAANSHVTACDMAHIPLPKRSVDVAIFCLSLMGCNVSDFIREARRVLKNGGLLKICEIASRIDSLEDFIANVELFGFKLIKTDSMSKMFLDFEFRAKSKRDGTTGSVPNIQLNPCIYKRR